MVQLREDLEHDDGLLSSQHDGEDGFCRVLSLPAAKVRVRVRVRVGRRGAARAARALRTR